MSIKRSVKRIGYRYGCEISSRGISRLEHLRSIRSCLKSDARIVFDVGANRGQTVFCFQPFFFRANIYCFEPDPEPFDALSRIASNLDRVSVFNIALGDSISEKTLFVNSASEGNSILRPSTNIPPQDVPGWLRGSCEKQVSVSTLDQFCREQGIESIDVLKIDVQGYEAHVLRGASELLSKGRIKLVFSEVQFAEYYEGQAYFEDVYGILKSHGYRLVDLYQKSREYNNSLVSCDALFIS